MKKSLKWRLSSLPTPIEVMELTKEKLITKEEAREIQVINVFDEYQVFTPESLTKHLQSLNHAHVAVCNKIKQLYSRQQFQFKGIYQ